MKKIASFGTAALVVLWAALTLFAWFGPQKDISQAERRPLAQMPELTVSSVFDGKFMGKFESYSLDQFPLRDSFRQVKSLFSRYILRQQDNNNIYVSDGYIAELGYPLDAGSVEHALKQFQLVHDLYLADSGSKVYATVVPDKGYYLAPQSGHLSMDYPVLFQTVQDGMPWATYVDITGVLSLEDYYRTDTHWKQENILPVATVLAQAMGNTVATEHTVTPLERPFYGVYYGQAALPMEAETMYILENPQLSSCQVYDFVTDSYTEVYNLEKLYGNDPYDIFLSGAQSLLRLENPNATTDKKLILFRDSFGSSLAPLLVQDYASITLIDIRYIQPQQLGKFVDFTGADVLFMYSSLVLNKNLI